MTPHVTFTFDNGPTPGVTEGVLDLLARRGIAATFFVIGSKLLDPTATALARAAHAAGHWIGNHTFTHAVALGDDPDPSRARHEIEATQDLIGPLSHPDKLFRPYGKSGTLGPHLLSRAAADLLLASCYTCVLWSSVPGDWRDPDGWVDRAVADIAARERTVLVLHDVPNACLPRLGELIARLDDLGVVYEQAFPDDVVLTRAGRRVNLSAGHVADA
ncbi:polysaccharide deacetylase family protein [Rhodoplanes elegans]|uniref:polysaccharide deacetylase family protein n=1 Tax=Rhodoplanes elegans TaxID=29408 RepID=UPI00147312D2|nr:polysaccharide deacetylase family protein [Rhodoplanes elegans]